MEESISINDSNETVLQANGDPVQSEFMNDSSDKSGNTPASLRYNDILWSGHYQIVVHESSLKESWVNKIREILDTPNENQEKEWTTNDFDKMAVKIGNHYPELRKLFKIRTSLSVKKSTDKQKARTIVSGLYRRWSKILPDKPKNVIGRRDQEAVNPFQSWPHATPLDSQQTGLKLVFNVGKGLFPIPPLQSTSTLGNNSLRQPIIQIPVGPPKILPISFNNHTRYPVIQIPVGSPDAENVVEHSQPQSIIQIPVGLPKVSNVINHNQPQSIMQIPVGSRPSSNNLAGVSILDLVLTSQTSPV